MLVTRQQRGHCQQVIAVDQAVSPCRISRILQVALACIAGNPILFGTVFGRQYPFAGLQIDAVAAFDALQNAFGLLAAIGDDFGELLQQTFGHRD